MYSWSMYLFGTTMARIVQSGTVLSHAISKIMLSMSLFDVLCQDRFASMSIRVALVNVDWCRTGSTLNANGEYEC